MNDLKYKDNDTLLDLEKELKSKYSSRVRQLESLILEIKEVEDKINSIVDTHDTITGILEERGLISLVTRK